MPRIGDAIARSCTYCKELHIARSHESRPQTAVLLDLVNATLDEGKAEDVIVIDLAGKTTIADYMVIASGRSQRQIAALAENVIQGIKDAGFGTPGSEGQARCDWVLIDAGDVIVHLFRPEIRAFYNLEKMWAVALPEPALEAEKGAALGA